MKTEESVKEPQVCLIKLKLSTALFLIILVWVENLSFGSKITPKSFKFDRSSMFELETE